MADERIEHLLRRAGFGASPDELAFFESLGSSAAADRLVDYDLLPDDVDGFIGQSGYARVSNGRLFAPNTRIGDARQRWLFRMIHSGRPLQEKMALFWHNHFATAYSKIAGAYGAEQASRLMAAKASEDEAGVRGQGELLRDLALGNFRDLLVAVAQDPAMLVWLDGRLNTKEKPQENFGRELMELFTMGVGFYTEDDVRAVARVFTGWNLRTVGGNPRREPTASYQFFYNPTQHDTDTKTFSFDIYADGGRTIPARSASGGLQDGLDLIEACARHPETGRRLARKLWTFFVSEVHEPDPAFVNDTAATYLQAGYDLREVVRSVLRSPQFDDPAYRFARYSWPVEFVVRAIKEIGWSGFSINSAISPLANMGQVLYEPPDVSGWNLGQGWFSSGSILARMNFTSVLIGTQRTTILNEANDQSQTAGTLLTYYLDRLSAAPYDDDAYQDLWDYLLDGGPWTGSDQQISVKAPGLVHLIAGSSEYQLV